MHVPHVHVFLISFGFRPAAAHSKPATGVFGDTGWDEPGLGASQAMHFCLSKAFWTSQVLHVQTSDETVAIPAAAPRDTLAAPFVSLESSLLT